MIKRWIVCEQETEEAARLARALGVSEILARLLVARGYGGEEAARSPK